MCLMVVLRIGCKDHFLHKKPKEHVLKSRNKPTRIFSQDSQRDHMESMIYKLDNINKH